MWSVVSLAIFIVVVVGLAAIVYTVCRGFGIAIPDWVVKVGWIVLGVLIAVVAIQFIASLLF
jgi:hypothetical protein